MKKILSLLLISAACCHARIWRDDLGREVEATFLRLDGDRVILRLPDGKEAGFPLAKLSPADRVYVAAMKTASAAATDGNFGAPWPERVTFEGDPQVTTVSENADEKLFIYESLNYRYTSDVRLSQSVVKGFALLFEATNKFCADLPLALASGRPADGKHPIKLFEKYGDYIEDGGMEGSAGVFLGKRGTVLIPLESLGVRPVGSSYMLDRDKANKTVPHELTHQLTPVAYFDEANGWFTEGIAEYVGVTGYRSGSFNVRNNRREFVSYVTAFGKKEDGGRGLGEEIHMGPLKDFMNLPYDKFLANTQMNYGCGLLVTTYFCHMDGKGDAARLKEYLKALRSGKSGEDALAVLLDGRSWAELEKDLAKAWSRAGVDLHFEHSAGKDGK